MFEDFKIIYSDTTARGENDGTPTQGAEGADEQIVVPLAKGQGSQVQDTAIGFDINVQTNSK